MPIDPLSAAPLVIQFHVVAALLALVLGLLQFAGPRGTPRHRIVGRLWVLLMVMVSGSSFFIHELRLFGPWSPIHVLSVVTLASLGYAIVAVRRGNIAAHRRAMISAYVLGLVVAGAFTLVPGRIMHAVIFGA